MWSTIGHVAGTRAKIGFAMPRADLDHTRSDLGFVLVGRTRFELVTSSVSGMAISSDMVAQGRVTAGRRGSAVMARRVGAGDAWRRCH